jgi:putative membrane protein
MFMELSKHEGADFDKHYMMHMVEDHEKDVALVEKWSKMAQDPEVKKWCEDSLPVLKEHLKMAKEVNDSVNKK